MSLSLIKSTISESLKIPVSGGRYFATVDPEDFERVSQHKWSLARSGNRRTFYAQRAADGTTEMMHNFITGARQVDHVNHDGLDNRRANLRDGSGCKNARNQRKTSSNASSQYKGVSWRKPDASHGQGWEVHIRVAGKQRYLGKFDDEVEAAKVYDYAALRHYGEYASLNFPTDPRRVIGTRSDGRPIYMIAGGSGEPEPVERPEGVTEDEWEALGDPGKKAIVRERARAEKAERDLAASRARPAPPAKKSEAETKPEVKTAAGDQPDVAAIVQQAVAAAIKPFAEREEQRQAEAAAGKVREAVLAAAKDRLHDATDALQIDLTAVLDDNGAADSTKVAKAIEDLLTAKPHLAKSTTRYAPPGIGGGSAPASRKDQVAALLAEMQRGAGVRVPTT